MYSSSCHASKKTKLPVKAPLELPSRSLLKNLSLGSHLYELLRYQSIPTMKKFIGNIHGNCFVILLMPDQDSTSSPANKKPAFYKADFLFYL
jgi:hypothetical protein